MKFNGKLFWIFCFVVQIGCTTKQNINDYDLTPILKAKVKLASKSAQPVKLNLCDELPFKWDNMFIIPPYSNVEVLKKQSFTNSKAIETMFPELTLDEGRCVILFVEENKIIRYSFLQRAILDLNDIMIPDKTSFKISKKMACSELYIKKEYNKFLLAY